MNSRLTLLTAGGVYESAGLLVLRVAVAGTLFLKHGVEKVTTFSTMAPHFADPIHIGPVPSLAVAMLADFLCSILIILGLGTRWAALFSFLNIFVAWSLVHHFAFYGRGQGEHGETIVLYLAAMLSFALTGAGRYSLDYSLTRPRV